MSSEKNSAKLQLIDVRKVFSPNTIDEVRALNGINFTMRDQDFVTIIGSNGAGKSTMLNIVAGIFPPERGGKVIIEDDDVTSLAEYRRAAYVSRVWQEPRMGTAGNLTIEENLSLAYKRGKAKNLHQAVNKQLRTLYREQLSVLGLGLEDRLTTNVGTLSGGQRQALSLVMASISHPSILLLDEHIATLDPRTAKTVLELTDEIVKRDKLTAMMVTHNMEMAIRYGNRLIMMHKGRIIVDMDEEQKKTLTLNDLITAFERASGEEFDDDSVLLRKRDGE